MKFFLRETESWSAVNKSKLHKTEKVSVIIEPSDSRYNSDLVCMVLADDIHVRLQSVKGTLLFYIGLFIVTFQVL